MKIVIVTGSRGWSDAETIQRLLARTLEKYPDAKLYVGDARGADTLAIGAWKALGGHGRRFNAHWDAEGKGAGYRRNERMVKAALDDATLGEVVCLAFRASGKSAGTDHTIGLCQKAGIQVVVSNA